jgi:hypothetical protein
MRGLHGFVDLRRYAEIIGGDDEMPETTALPPETVALRAQRTVSRRSRRK